MLQYLKHLMLEAIPRRYLALGMSKPQFGSAARVCR